MARIVVTAPAYTKSKYNPKELKALESLVTDAVEVNISLGTILSRMYSFPHRNQLGLTWCSGVCAFTHKAGIHAKAILNDPFIRLLASSSYDT